MASLLLKVREIFNSAQDGDVVLSKLCEKMAKLQVEVTESQFWDAFIHHVQKSIIYYKSEPAVERVMDFIANFATYSTRLKSKQKDDEKKVDHLQLSLTQSEDSLLDDEIIEPFLLACFSLFINLHNAREKGVRLRCCQLINKMLNLLGDEDCIDEGLSDKIYECMMVRIKDVYPQIRVQAVLALYRLQDPTDEECPVIDAYLCSLERDINSLVRKTILTKIALSRKTLPYIVERVRDVNDFNRKTAFNILAEKVSIRALSIAQRIKLLTVGLKNDRSIDVQNACRLMLKAWFRACNHNFVKLLEALDTESDPACSELAVESLLKGETPDKLQEYKKQIDEFVGENMNLSEHLFTLEKVFFWYMFGKHLKTCNDSEFLLQQILPELTNLCQIIRLYSEKNFIDSAILTAFEGAEQSEFILEYLLNLAGLLDFSDEIGRKNLRSLVHDLLVLESIPISLVNVLVKRFKDVERDEDSFVLSVVETIADIKQPLVQVVSTAMKERSRKMQLQLARISVDIHECNDDLECAIKQQDYQQAALLKDHISELEKQKADIQAILNECQEQVTKRVIRDEDPETTLKCLTVGTAMLSEIDKRGLSATLMTLKDELFFDGVRNEDPVIRNEAVKGLGLLCYLKKEFAAQHLVFFMQVVQVDHELVQITAIKVLFDLFLMYGLTNFGQEIDFEGNRETDECDESKNMELDGVDTIVPETPLKEQQGGTDDVKETEDKESTAAAEGILSILLMFLQNKSSALRTVVVEGMAKMMLTGRVLSANILTRLIVAWYNPMTENDTQLRHCLATFLPMFAFQSRSNLALMEEAFLPTLHTIINAPSTSPLSQIDVMNVVNLFIQLTDIRNLSSFRKGSGTLSFEDEDSYVHDSLAIKISNEILNNPEEGHVKLLCKALNQLTICPKNVIILSDLIELSSQMIEKLSNNRLAKNMIERFLLRLEGHSFEVATRTENETQPSSPCAVSGSYLVSDNVENLVSDNKNHEVLAKNRDVLTCTPSGVLKDPLKLTLKSELSVRSRRNVSFASPPHKMQRLSTSSPDFHIG